jgi:hypothetical protein
VRAWAPKGGTLAECKEEQEEERTVEQRQITETPGASERSWLFLWKEVLCSFVKSLATQQT